MKALCGTSDPPFARASNPARDAGREAQVDVTVSGGRRGAVRFTTHAGLEAVGATEPSPRIAAILGALVRVHHGASRASCAYGLEHRIEHQLAVDRGADGPPDDLSQNRSKTVAR
jgi:hypothetical protein